MKEKLKEYIEWQIEIAKSDIKMYLDDNETLWKNSDVLMACCRSRIAAFEMVLEKLDRI